MIGKFLKRNYHFLGKSNKYYFRQESKFDAKKDYYKILNVDKDTKIGQIKQSYFKLAKQYHPDVSKGNEAKFKQISQAYAVLSNQQVKQQYDAARLFGSFASRMGSKAQSGQYHYQSYQSQYANMSQSQRQQLKRQFQRKMRSIGLYFLGFLVFWAFFSRYPHRFYTEVNGELIPFVPQPMNPLQGGQGAPYGNSIPYQPPGYAPSQGAYSSYVTPQYPNNQFGGSQYSGNQYSGSQFSGNQYGGRQYGGGNANNLYNPANYGTNQGGQNNNEPSEYAVMSPQTIQPYPNSPYAPKTMQANYQPNYKAEAPDNFK